MSAEQYRVYLAGKVAKNDWRHTHFTGLRSSYSWDALEVEQPWPECVDDALAEGVGYVGPFFVSCDHGCAHLFDHGVGQCNGDTHDNTIHREWVAKQCLQAIERAQIVIAKVDDDAHGTLVEIGYALALKKVVFIVAGDNAYEAWFPFSAPGAYVVHCVDEALQYVANWAKIRAELNLCESPIEHEFLKAMRRVPNLKQFIPQVVAMGGKYRIDFADEANKIGIELDGHEFHSSKEQFTKDRQRQRDLEAEGWRIIRFSGSEVHADAGQCVTELQSWLEKINPTTTS